MEEQVVYSQHKFDSTQEECMLSITLGSPGDMSRRSVLALKVPGFFQGSLPHDLKAFCESGHYLFENILDNMK